MGGRGSKGRPRALHNVPNPQLPPPELEPPREPEAPPEMPDEAPPTPPTPVSGDLSDKPLLDNKWGEASALHSEVCYHDDGPVGTALRSMGADARMDVDGQPLANVVGVIATDVVAGRRTAQQGVDDVKALRERLPATSQAHSELGDAIRKMDGPDTPPPAMPATAPEPLRQLAADLHAVPIVRGDPARELAPVVGLADDFAAGKASRGRLIREVRDLANKRHEAFSDSGKMEIDRAVLRATEALKKLPPEAFQRPSLPS
jgi:hypothetical protein